MFWREKQVLNTLFQNGNAPVVARPRPISVNIGLFERGVPSGCYHEVLEDSDTFVESCARKTETFGIPSLPFYVKLREKVKQHVFLNMARANRMERFKL